MSSERSTPLVSVLIPVYNAGEYLRPAVLSITNQSYENLEIIVVDDGSTDNCVNTIKDIEDNRVQIFVKENGGKSSALNLALGKITGEFWMIQDADDLSYPKRVEEQLCELQKNVNLAAIYVGNDLIFRGKRFAPIYPQKTAEDCRNEIADFRLPAHDATGMYRLTMTKRLFFDNDLKIGQGVDYVWRVGELFPIAVLEACLYSHRVNHQSVTHKRPFDNFEKINIVIKKACERRGCNFQDKKINCTPLTLKKKRGMDSVLPYAINSVITLKRKKAYSDSLKTALLCVAFHPFDYMFYKPLVFFFIPNNLLEYYRVLKNN